MALSAVVYQVDVNVSNVDTGIYESFSQRVAQHPSESLDYLLTRILAFCIEYQEGIAFGQSIGTNGGDEPAIWVKDYTGAVKLWIEVGQPDPDKLHKASKHAERVLVYAQRDPETLRRNLENKTIHQADQIMIRSFERGFIAALTGKLERRNTLDVSVTEGTLYLTFNGFSAQTPINAVALGG